MGSNLIPTELTPKTKAFLEAITKPRLNAKGEPLSPTSAQKQGMVIAELLSSHRQSLLYSRADERFYYQRQGEQLYRALDERDITDLIQEPMLKLGFFFSATEYRHIQELMRIYIPDIIQISKRFIMVSEHIFWDKEKGTLTDSASEPVFYKLFNTEVETKHVVKVPKFSTEQEERLWETYEQVKGEIERGEEIERFEPLRTWANRSHDIYMDLHRAHAYCFLNVLPEGAYLMIGGAAGGKSTYAGMTHTIFGYDNTSRVTLADMGDWHSNHDLSYSLMNCPDEDEDKALSSQAIFKTVADHGLVELNTMASHERLKVNCDFMCFFPMNHLPKWEGSGASACMRRSLVIPFNADLKKYDNGTEDFAKKTFTADFMCEYLGSVFAYAYYYSRHPLVFSDTMAAQMGQLAGELSSYLLYLPRFFKYFNGYTSKRLVFQDYVNWCLIHEVKPCKRDEFMFHLGLKIPNSPKGIMPIDGRNQRYYRGEGKGALMSELYRPSNTGSKIGRLNVVHEVGGSMVDELDKYYEEHETRKLVK